MSAGKINFQFHTAAQSMEKKKTQNVSFSRQRRQIIGNVFNEHLNHFTHNLKWWHFQILLLAELLPSVGLVFLVGEYKYSISETHPLRRAPHEGCDPHQSPLTLHMRLITLQSQHWPLQWRMHFLPHGFSFHLKPDCPFTWNISVLPGTEGLIDSPGVHCTGLKPGSWPLFTQHQVLCGSTWEMMAMPVEMGAMFASTTAARFCFLCQQDIAIHPQFSTVWLEVRSIRLLAKSLD